MGDLQCRVGSVSQSGAASVDAYTDTADQIAHADGKSGPEEGISGEVV
jgi:hypothetical protein